jgi:hypothetical protein
MACEGGDSWGDSWTHTDCLLCSEAYSRALPGCGLTRCAVSAEFCCSYRSEGRGPVPAAHHRFRGSMGADGLTSCAEDAVHRQVCPGRAPAGGDDEQHRRPLWGMREDEEKR